MNFVIFEKWAVERVKWSSLIAIGDSLKQEEFNVEYFIPSCFNLDMGDIPITPEKTITGIFTWYWNYFNIQEYYKDKLDVYTVDWGFLARDKGYQFIVKNNSFVENKPSDRFEELKLTIRSAYKEDGHILICQQNHHNDWYRRVIKMVEENTSKKVKVRAYDSDPKTLKSDLNGASALVTYNSTAMYQAVLGKIPVYCSKYAPIANSKTALDLGIVSLDLSTIDNAKKIEDPVPFLSNVAYNQYTLEEMRKGIWIKELV